MDPTRKLTLTTASNAQALMGILVIGGDAVVFRFIRRSLPPTQDDFFETVSEFADANTLSIAAMGVNEASSVAPAAITSKCLVLALELFMSEEMGSAFTATGFVRFWTSLVQGHIFRI